MEIFKLYDVDRDVLDGFLIYEECKKLLEIFGNGKLLGEDGFMVEFYKYFFDFVGVDLLVSFNRVYEFGRLLVF